ncbi:MAG: hypothetical protein ACRD3D_00400 [Terriglobia bacterium]
MTNQDSQLKNPKQPQTLTDDQIVTERKLPRRSFLATGGVFLAGAAALVSGARAFAEQDPDKKKASDSDKTDRTRTTSSDPDKKREPDSDRTDRKKGSDPDKRKSSDPDKKKESDPDH